MLAHAQLVKVGIETMVIHEAGDGTKTTQLSTVFVVW